MNWMPHGTCILWDPRILVLDVLSNLVIAASYFTIPWFLWRVLKQFDGAMKNLGLKAVLWAFSVFIGACGLTHVMDIVTIWLPFYILDIVVRALTATASAATAYGLVKILPLLVRGANGPRPE